MNSTDEILQAALALPEASRIALVDQILASLDESSSPEIQQLWAQEAEDRIRAFERGEIGASPGPEVRRG